MKTKKEQQLNFGPVKVIGGHHKGKIGYYDDNAEDSDKCIVYFNGNLLCGPYYYISPKHLRPTKNYKVTKYAGVVVQ